MPSYCNVASCIGICVPEKFTLEEIMLKKYGLACLVAGMQLMLAMLPQDAMAQSDVNLARLENVMKRIRAGEPVKVAFIGGSITTGYATSPPEEKGWAAQVGRWLQQQAPTGKVEIQNLGISGTDSAAAAQRVYEQAIVTHADLVFVEFGVNDQWLDAQVRKLSFEGLLRQLLKAPAHPAVVTLHLTQQGNRERDAVQEQLRIARHYQLLSIDFGAWVDAQAKAGNVSWKTLYDEPIHPNQSGHDAIARAVIASLELAERPSTATPKSAGELPLPLYGDDFEYVRNLGNHDVRPYFNHGFTRGGDVHEEWQRRPGGGKEGWVSEQDDASMSFLVYGRQIGIFHAESEHYRNLEAWVDEQAPVLLREQNPERHGYLGWAYTPVGRDLEPGAHLLHVRMQKDTWAGSGRSAGIVSIMSAGIGLPYAPAFEFDNGQSKSHLIGADNPDLLYVGRFDNADHKAPAMAWSGSEIRARFTGRNLTLRFEALSGANYFNVSVDGRNYRLDLERGSSSDYRLKVVLAPGEHDLSIVKRSEAYFSQARFHGLLLDADAKLAARPAARPLRLEFYGDSITAGACNGDSDNDQYEDMSTHDGTRAYGAITARNLGADYVGIAVSGTGVVRSWNEVLLPEVFDRVAPQADSPRADFSGRSPDVVVINLGQNDFGLPQSRSEPFPADFETKYIEFIKKLRALYPDARIVCTLGGMSGWRNSPELLHAFEQAVHKLQVDDRKIWLYRFKAYTDNHPRIDTHELLATELTRFLREEVLK
jgi:lysophospholipase L1-like esterase